MLAPDGRRQPHEALSGPHYLWNVAPLVGESPLTAATAAC